MYIFATEIRVKSAEKRANTATDYSVPVFIIDIIT